MVKLPSQQLDFRNQIKLECTRRSRVLRSTIFGTVFSSDTDTSGYLVGCSSDGMLLIWDCDRRSSSTSSDGDDHSKRRRIEESQSKAPVFKLQVCKGALYDVKLIPESDGTDSIIVTCGDNGIFVYNNFLSSIQNGDIHIKPEPISQLKPYPDIYASKMRIEINRISYDASLGHLFAAGGDGCGYVWDIIASKLVGNLCEESQMTSTTNCTMNVIKAIGSNSELSCNNCVLTGGDGMNNPLCIWSGKDHKLIQSTPIGDNSGTQRSNEKNSNSWVSCIDSDDAGRWVVVGGGSRENTKSGAENGFVQLFNLQSRTVSSYKETRENIHDIAFHSHSNKVLSIGNQSVVSFWNPMDFSVGQTGRAWLSSPASFCIGIHPTNDMVAIGNVSSSIDCFSEYLTRTSTIIR